MRRGREQDPDAFRCIGCETPTRGGRLCGACRDEAEIMRTMSPVCGSNQDGAFLRARSVSLDEAKAIWPDNIKPADGDSYDDAVAANDEGGE